MSSCREDTQGIDQREQLTNTTERILASDHSLSHLQRAWAVAISASENLLHLRFRPAASQVDRLAFEIVVGFDESHRAALGPHDHRMRGGHCATDPHARQKRAGADPRGHEDDIVAAGQIIFS